jgi:integrase/recombinase XerD
MYPSKTRPVSRGPLPERIRETGNSQRVTSSLPSPDTRLPADKTSHLLQLYEEDLRLRYAAGTVKQYLGSVRLLLAWLDERGIDLAAARTDDLVAFQSDLYARRRADGKPHTTGYHVNRVKAIKSFFRFLYRRSFLVHDPAAAVEYPRMEKRLPRNILTRQEAKRIIETANEKTPLGLRDRALLEILYGTGIRYGECANLALDDVDVEDGLLRIVQGKGRKDRNVPLTTAAARSIEAYLLKGRPRLAGRNAKRFLFLTCRGRRLTNGFMNYLLQQYASKAGIRKRVTCHTFRHSVATHLLKGRADIRHIQALLGHACLSSTQLYTHVAIADLKNVLRRAHPRGR